MNNDIRELALYRLARAEESFNDAEILFKNESLYSAVNRYYYAAFYAARALLATKHLDSSKHSGVISLFQQHFVKTEIIPPDIAKALSRSFEERIDIDYEDFVSVPKEELEKIREQVKRFIAECKKVLKDMLEK